MSRHEISQHHLEEKPLHQTIYQIGFAKYIQRIENLGNAFSKHKKITCIDSRIAGGFRLPASGVFLPEEVLKRIITASGADTLTSHDNCGAVKNYLLQQGESNVLTDEFARMIATEKAEKLGLRHEHYHAEKLRGPKNGHSAKVIYADGTGEFCPHSLAELPKGFVVSFKHRKIKHSIAEVEFALNIAFSDHGLGSLIDKCNPFHLVAIGETRRQVADIYQELARIAALNNYVWASGFLKP